MLKNTKKIHFKIFFPIIPMGAKRYSCPIRLLRLIYYLQKIEDFWKSFSPIVLKLRD